MKKLALVVAALLVAAPAVYPQIQTVNLEQTTPEALGSLLAGPGAQITNVRFEGNPIAAGTFVGGAAAGLGIESGVILSTGPIEHIVGPNDEAGKSGTLGTPGDPDLDVLVEPNTTQDSTILEFDVITATDELSIAYVFASEEYKEFVGSAFNDVFGFYVNGRNVAFVAGDPGRTVSVNSINHESNTTFYIDNPSDNPVADTQFDGFTTLLTANATVTPGAITRVKLAIADTSDSILDSAVILAAGGISGGAVSIIVEPMSQLGLAGDSLTYGVRILGVPEGLSFDLEMAEGPEGFEIAFARPTVVGLEDDAPIDTTMVVTSPLDALPVPHPLQIRGYGARGSQETGDFEEFEAIGSFVYEVICDPPLILSRSEDQPESMTVPAGEIVTLSVNPTGGTPPYRYQWYWGPSGSFKFPIDRATSSTYTTPPIQQVSQYWVRVMNACGDDYSWTATIVPEGKTAPKKTGRQRGASRGD